MTEFFKIYVKTLFFMFTINVITNQFLMNCSNLVKTKSDFLLLYCQYTDSYNNYYQPNYQNSLSNIAFLLQLCLCNESQLELVILHACMLHSIQTLKSPCHSLTKVYNPYQCSCNFFLRHIRFKGSPPSLLKPFCYNIDMKPKKLQI